MAFYASCPHCKLPNLVEDELRDQSLVCAGCRTTYRPFRQAAQPTWTSPPTRPDPPPAPAQGTKADVWADSYLARPKPPLGLPGQQAGRTAQGLLVLVLLVEFFHVIASSLIWLGALADNREDAAVFNLWQAGAGCYCLFGLGFILAGVFFLIWFGNAYANLPRLGAGAGRFHPALAVVSFFVPGVNLILPALIMQELWRASEPADAERPGSEVMGNIKISCWWTLWVLSLVYFGSLIAFPIVFSNHGRNMGPAMTQLMFLVNILGPSFTIASGLLLIRLIDDIIVRQSKRYQAVIIAQADRFEDD